MRFIKDFKMGGIGGLLGTAGGAGGTGFGSPAATNVIQPFNSQTAQDAQKQAQDALSQQQNFVNQVNAQNGLGNQTSVYNQLQGVANGTGPNPAQAQLAQATGANTANQAALMAGQRGAGANAGLIARQAAMQGANNQQQAAGQAATMQANQSLNALGQMGGLSTNMANQQAGAISGLNNASQGQEGQVLGNIQGSNNANVGMQSNINNVNGQLANTQLQGQQAMIGGLMNSGSNLMSAMARGGMVKPHFDDGGEVGDTSNQSGIAAPSAPAQDAAPNTSTPAFGSDSGAAALSGQKSGGGGGGGGIMKLAAMAAQGGQVPMYADGGQTTQSTGPMSAIGRFAKGMQNKPGSPAQATPNYGNAGANALYQGMASFGQNIKPKSFDQQLASSPMQQQPAVQDLNMNQVAAAKGGKVPAMVSPGEKYLDRSAVEQVKAGADPMQAGETIPGKPKVDGAKNSYANDTVPKDLEEGGIILPRSVTQSKNPEWAAHKFMRDYMAKGGMVGGLHSKSRKKKAK